MSEEKKITKQKQRHAVEIVPDAASLATRASEWLIEQIVHAVERRGRAVIALSGGSTPKAIFECLAQHPWRDRIPWDALHLVWGDERFVGKDDAASNLLMTRKALLDHVDMPASHVYPIPSDDGAGAGAGTVEETFERARVAAALYATTLHAIHGSNHFTDDNPLFDVVMLGLGEDGHTASLFAGTDALEEKTAWVVAVKTDNATAPVRITLTYPALESTHAVLFLVSGAAKRDVVRRVLQGDESLPAARVHPVGGTLWIMDEAAAR
ncbi:MAG: 6-phosphogluconolactonase [Burkholderiaceae bacterium]